jgi:fatty-acyl-CoA synthase/long-chain acyl-CoA synthetase
VEVALLDDGGELILGANEPGLLYARGERVFAGYENDPEATALAKWHDYATSGDIAYRDDDGFYYICDRAKDVIISGGVNVYPAEVEAVLDMHPDVAESAVVGLPDPVWGERVHAVVTLRQGCTVSVDELIEFCRKRVSSSKRPRSVSIVDQLPRAESGKVLKRKLREHLSESGI